MGSALTGQRYVALDFFPNVPAVSIDTRRMPIELPTLPNRRMQAVAKIVTVDRRSARVCEARVLIERGSRL